MMHLESSPHFVGESWKEVGPMVVGHCLSNQVGVTDLLLLGHINKFQSVCHNFVE